MRTPAVAPATPMALRIVLAAIALVSVGAPAFLVGTAPRIVVHQRTPVVISRRVVPQAELPPVEPVQLQAVDPDDARAINAAIAFSSLPNPAARPYRLTGAADSQARAIDCLAAAVYYEAGDDTVGQRAVAQVVINRVRHPAFPKSICGVVFQGAERSTGCQFTFTCDGAMLRYRPSPAAWQRARDVARLALQGSVYRPVGHATHYHTDWVVPYWSASLEKITAVDTHLFFRWTGWWGTPPAFNRGYAGTEPNVPLMARLSPAHQGQAEEGSAGIDPLSESIDPGSIPASAVPDPIGAAGGDADSFLVTLDRRMEADAFAALAIKTCGERAYCKFMAWTDPSQTPAQLPLTNAQVASMAFSYLRDQSQGFAKALWNCRLFKRPSPVQCMRAQPPAPAPAPAAATTLEQAITLPSLAGVRRKRDAEPADAPAAAAATPAARPSPAPGGE